MILLALSAASVAAQQPPRDSARADSAARLPAVVTTVLRAPLPVVRAPYAVSTVTREAAQTARQGFAVDEALRGVPGVQVDNRFNAALGERISIRGFGARTQFGVRGVKVIVDGVPANVIQDQLGHSSLATTDTYLRHIAPTQRIERLRQREWSA